MAAGSGETKRRRPVRVPGVGKRGPAGRVILRFPAEKSIRQRQRRPFPSKPLLNPFSGNQACRPTQPAVEGKALSGVASPSVSRLFGSDSPHKPRRPRTRHLTELVLPFYRCENPPRRRPGPAWSPSDVRAREHKEYRPASPNRRDVRGRILPGGARRVILAAVFANGLSTCALPGGRANGFARQLRRSTSRRVP
jgi:hypothetical protein